MKRLEIATNIAILVASVALVSSLVRQHFFSDDSRGTRREQVAVGSQFTLAGVDWTSSNATLVLALSTTCHFCEESAPFYRNLTAAVRGSKTAIVAVFPENPATAMDYLRGKEIDIPIVRQSTLAEVHIRGTPTVVLVDRSGRVRRVWAGRLPPDAEHEVLAAARTAND